MTCKVVRIVEHDQLVLLHISGHLQEVHVNMIAELIAKEIDPVVLDLAEVALVDREAVRFLATCDVRGIGLRNCPGFIREWVARERDVGHG
jgi:anti-anti-sigma regulatory factor